ncbi:ABC transporter permease, partial [uncultured Methylobacterium sp.]|uniref:ABC transporter permease n=1 Tax=uncultured Methylobacterium sp. TaxID=157278 RepID=UPI0035CA6179
MLRFLVKRLALAVPTLVLASMIIFALQQLLPGDAATALSGEERDPAVVAFIREKYHLDRPFPVRYGYWAAGVLRGDLGESIRLQKPVGELVREKLPVTLELACLAMLVALAIGVPMGILSAVRRGTWADTLANGVALWGLSVPNFWLGILMILLFSVQLGWLPASGYVPPGEGLIDNLKAMAMPAFVLGNAIAAVMMRHTRAAMLGVLGSD